jgi:hypothetical protein
MSRNLIIILVRGAVALARGLLDGPAARQRRGVGQAQAFRSNIGPKVAADPRFASVALGLTTHPALRVYGDVSDEGALRDVDAFLVTRRTRPSASSLM